MSRLKRPNNFEEKLKESFEDLEIRPSEKLWANLESNLQADTFEPAIREKLGTFSVEPNESVWFKIQSMLPDNRRQKGLVYFIVFLIAAMGTYAGFWSYEHIGSASKEKALTYSQTKKVEPLAEPKSAQQPMVQPADEASSKALTQAEQPAELVQPKSKENRLERKHSNLLSAESSKNSEPTIAHSASSSSSVHQENSSNNQVSKRNRKKLEAVTKNSSTENGSGQPPTNQNTEENRPIIHDAINPPPKASDLGSNHSDKIKEIPSASTQTTPSEQAVNAASTANKHLPDSSQKTPEVAKTYAYMQPDEEPGHYSITAMMGIIVGKMLLNAPSSPAYNLNASMTLRKKMETTAVDWTGGFLFTDHLNEHWSVTTGLQITNFRQNLNYAIVTPSGNISGVQIQPSTAYINPTDSIVLGTGRQLTNTYSFTEIPISIGYAFTTNSAVGFELTGGISYAFLTSVNAYVPDPSCIGLLTANNKDAFPKFRNTVFVQIAPAMTVRINGAVQLGVMPQFKMGVRNMVGLSGYTQQLPIAGTLMFFLRKRF